MDDVSSCAVVDASIEIRGDGGPARGEMLTRATTDSRGRFHLRRPKRAERLRVTAVGFAPTAWLIDDDLATEVRLVRPGCITGRVLVGEDQRPVDGATVEARGASSTAEVVTTTNAKGGFRMTGLAPGRYVLTARGEGIWMEALSAGAEVSDRLPHVAVRSGEEAIRDVPVQRSGRIQGRVLTSSGRAVPGAPILGPDPGGPSVATDDEGSFVLSSVPPGRYESLSLGPLPGLRWHPRPRAPIDVRAGDTSTVALECVPDADWPVIHAVVVDTEQAPIDRAYVRSSPQGGGGETRPDGSVQLLIRGYHHAGPLVVEAGATGYISQRITVPVPEDDRPPIELRFTLSRARRLEGRVVDLGGAAVPEARIVARRGVGDDRRTKSNADGTFRVWVDDVGPWSIGVASQTDATEITEALETSAPASDLYVVIMPEHARGLPLRIVGPDRRPIPMAEICVRRHGEDVPQRWTAEGGHTRVIDARGPLDIEVHSARDAGGRPLSLGPARVAIAAVMRTEPLEVRLPEGLTIEGTFVDERGRRRRDIGVLARPRAATERGRRPAPARDVSAHALATSDSCGRFLLRGLGAEPYELHVDTSTEFEPIAPVVVTPGTTDVPLVLRSTARAVVTVVDTEGIPVPEAKVHLFSREADGSVRTTERTSGLDGTVVLHGIASSRRHTLRAWPPTYRQTSAPVTLRDWRPTSTTVQLPETMRIDVRMVDAEGHPIRGYRLRDRQGRVHVESCPSLRADTGRAVLPVGTYTLEATGPVMKGDLQAAGAIFEVTPQSRDVVVVWPGSPLRVQVHGGSQPNSMLRAWLGRLDGDEVVAWSEVTSRSDRIEIPGLDPARVYVLLLAPDEQGATALLGPVRPRSRPYALTPTVPPERTGRVLLPPGATATRVHARAPATLRSPEGRSIRFAHRPAAPTWSGTIDASGAFSIRGVPDGHVRLVIDWQMDGIPRERSTFHDGSPLEIVLDAQ